MKAFISLTLTVLVIPFISANDAPLGITPSVRWSEIISGETPDQPIIYQYEIGRDTVINELSYYQLMKDSVFFGAVREDEYRQVFVYFPDTGQEELLYDFNWGNETDSIRLFNNQPYAVKTCGWSKIIQGIGSLNGFFAPLDEPETATTELLCYWKNEQLLYLNPSYTNCEGGKTYKSCFGKEYTKHTVIVDGIDYRFSYTYMINEQLEFIDLGNNSVFGNFTEDVSSGELIFKWKDYWEGDTERKIMNLNVWTGDTIPFGDDNHCYQYYYSDRYYVDSNGKRVFYSLVDSIYFEDHRKYVRMDVDVWFSWIGGCPERLLFVEGRGPNTGLWPFSSYTYDCSYLLCHETESESYLNPRFNACYYLQGEVASPRLSKFVEAAQTGTVLQLRFALPFSGKLYLYDSLGRRQLEDIVNNQMEATLGIGDLPAGLYLLKCKGIDDMIPTTTTKIIIY